MENLYLNYIIKVCIGSTLLYTSHFIFIKRDTFFHLKRIYLLAILLLPVIYPLIVLHIPDETINTKIILQTIFINGDNISEYINRPNTTLHNINRWNIIPYAWIIGIIILSINFYIKINTIQKLFSKRKLMKIRIEENCNIYKMNNEYVSSFSFFNHIFIHKTDHNTEQKIIQHEKLHIKYHHSLELIFVELISITFWWNPMIWIIKKEIKLNHEYMVDQKIIEQGENKKNYQYSLLTESIKNTSTSITNQFNVSQLKQRIRMMNKKRTNQLAYGKYLFFMIFPMLLLTANSQSTMANEPNLLKDIISTEINQNKDKAYQEVEIMPEYPGKEQGLMKFISENLKYPTNAQAENIQGRVIVKFIINKQGKVINPEIIKGLSPECDEEVLRIIKLMPDWTPGMQDGKNVDVYFNLPIAFRLPHE